MLIEFERGRPIIVDRPLYRELVKAAIKRTHDDLEAKAATAAKEKKTARASKAAGRPGHRGQARARRAAARADRPGARRQPRPRPRARPQPHHRRPGRHRRRAVLRLRAARRRPRQLARTPRPGSGSRGSPPAASASSSTSCAPTSPRPARTAAAAGCAYDYGDHRDPQAALAWLWKFIDGAKTAGELYGRALVVIAAEQHATPARRARPASGCPPRRWSSHKDIAAKALKKLAGPHVPASLTQLEQAVKRAHAAYDKAETAAREQQRAERQPVEPDADDGATSSTRTSTTPRSRAPPAGGPTRHPMVARPGGRAGGGGSARQRGGPQARKEPTMARRFNRKPLTDDERDARRQADRERIEQAARALLTTDGWQRWIKVRASNGLSRYSLGNQMLIAIECHAARDHPDLRRRLPRLPRPQPLRAQGREGDPDPRPRHRQAARRRTARRPARSRSSSAPSRSSTSA